MTVPRSRLLADAATVRTLLAGIAAGLAEDLDPSEDVLMVGIHGKGVVVAEHLSRMLGRIREREIPTGTLDVGMHRDDLDRKPVPLLQPMSLPATIADRTVILVDDVIHTGRTVRAALDALHDFGRPARVLLAVLVDRGHRSLPIAPDHAGKRVEVGEDERIRIATLDGGEGFEARIDHR